MATTKLDLIINMYERMTIDRKYKSISKLLRSFVIIVISIDMEVLDVISSTTNHLWILVENWINFFLDMKSIYDNLYFDLFTLFVIINSKKSMNDKSNPWYENMIFLWHVLGVTKTRCRCWQFTMKIMYRRFFDKTTE